MYPKLRYFFSTYFHQDWFLLEGETLEDVLNNFKKNETNQICQEVILELNLLIKEKYVDANFIYSLGCFMIPNTDVEGNVISWLKRIRGYLSVEKDQS
ncbi:contact-dependent growth inhibition system immunity protein [Mannheimia indoligenes]|uniref:contact-dependent growth inhibition system immunity protein n=1 Tax=Mannheimia indoligenes TaxID=3103145 RepID=UPI002FE68828